MTRHRSLCALLLAGTALLGVVNANTAAHAVDIVLDPTNLIENTLQAAYALEQIGNQIKSLENEAQMLINEGKNLAKLDYSAVGEIEGALGEISNLLKEVDRIAYDVDAIDKAFAERYSAVDMNATDAALIANAEERWSDAVSAFRHAMTVQAGAVNNLAELKDQTKELATQSQNAEGILEATQAGNQILALQTSQLADLVAVLSSDARAQALAEARKTAAEAQAQEQYRRFLTRANGYEPADVKMFHQ